ncbi:MAG TPA: FAD-binding oxidoreductase, partial [Lapillicoccus sp.]|nr:FAD-binding oxidoreductase [Lapillicoccus sp.]
MVEVSTDVVHALEQVGLEVRADAGTRSMYASDASLYRIPPLAVVRPRDVDDVAATLAVARETGVPVTSRGAGTSVAGNAVGRGVVLDFSRHLNRVLSVDPEARTAVVEPGTVHAVLQRAVAPHGIRFGPDPSTHPRCTIGGMIGNNACGSRSLAYGRTSDNVVGLELLTAAGQTLSTGYDESGVPHARGADDVLAEVRSVMSRHLS